LRLDDIAFRIGRVDGLLARRQQRRPNAWIRLCTPALPIRQQLGVQQVDDAVLDRPGQEAEISQMISSPRPSWAVSMILLTFVLQM